MTFLLFPRFPKLFHTSVIRFQPNKNVHKLSGYQAPFDESQKKEILEKINKLPENELWPYTTKRLSKQISEYRVKSGEFSSVEQLLDLQKVEPSHLITLCKKLLKNKSYEDSSKKAVPTMKIQRIATRQFSGISPKPDLGLWNSFENPVLVGISVNLQGITFARIDSRRQFIEWVVLNGIENPNSQICFQQRNLFEYASEIVSRFPEADYYLFEEPPPILPKDPNLKHKVNLIKLRSTLMTIMMKRKHMHNVGIHTIKPSVLDNMFDLKIGNERTSVKNAMDRIISGTHGEDALFSVDISEKYWIHYHKCNKKGQEYLASSLLKALAFNHVCRVISLNQA